MKFGPNPAVLTGSITLVALLRVMMAPLPNIEPIMLFAIPLAIVMGPISGFVFAFGARSVSDVMMGSVGLWTIYTSLTYGLIGLICGLLSKLKKEWGRLSLTLLSFAMVLFYDTVTSIFFALQFMIPVPIALINMIPFLILHLSSCVLVFLFAPSLIKAAQAMKEFSPAKFMKDMRFYV